VNIQITIPHKRDDHF